MCTKFTLEKKTELTKKSKMRREKFRAAFSGGVPDMAVLYNAKGGTGSYPVMWG